MIVLTVKTLDSQNHTFTVDDDITVEQFKAKIADTVNIPAETQRIIYCGRVLQDSSKLSDYDVNGKVVHLVQRPPPGQNPSSARSSSPQPQRRGFRGFDNENTMYLGSMAFPSNLMESQGIVPPPPTHSLAGSRLNVARRMLRRAEAVINLLENPSARPSDQPNAEEQQEEEVTPIIEARVIVPPGNSDNIDEAMVLSAVHNTLLDAASSSMPMATETRNDGNTSEQSSESPPVERSAASTPEEGANNGEGSSSGTQRTTGVSARSLAENACRTSEMADLLTTLNQLQNRFQPFLERYRHFMVEDPIIPQENVRQTQAMLTRVSEVMHFLGHAYHSLSDIIIRVRTQPPRPLLCRPILIQHSAVVQAGIPIQVEVAQINLSAERTTTTTIGTTTSSNTSTTTTATDTTRPTATASGGTPPTVNFRGFPFIPAASMRVQSFPIEVRTGARPNPNNNNNTVGNTASSTTTSTASTATSTTTTSTENTFNVPNFNNSSVEFFMEVTPDGTLNGPPPEFLQSLVQMAGQIMNRITTTAPTLDTTTTTNTSSTSSTQTTPSVPSQTTNQNTPQRAANTSSTNSTNTRSTPRPHVHLAQQAMQGGFDPFLPCNSHHVTHRRRQQGGANRPREESGEQAAAVHNVQNLFEELIRGGRDRSGSGRGASGESSANGSGERRSETASPDAIPTPPHVVMQGLSNVLPNIQGLLGNLPNFLQGSPIADILQQLPGDDSGGNGGESIISDFLMMLSRHLTIIDMFALNTGNFEPLNRVTGEIQNFFNTRILDGNTGPEAINAGVDRIMGEMQSFLQNFSRLRVRDDIDVIRSLETLFRRRLPEILTTATNLNSQNLRSMMDNTMLLGRTTLAVTLRASANGQPGVEETFQQIITSYMPGIPAELQNWTRMTSCATLRRILANLGVSESDVEQYIVRNTDVQMAAPSEPLSEVRTTVTETEPMDLDEPVAGNAVTALPPLSLGDDQEPLPNVVLGAESWHSEVPEDWVPIITRDVQRQRRQSAQAPFSDGYLSGMPTKRRKIVNSTKPQGSLTQVISESVRRAVTTSGLTSVAPLETVAQSAGESSEVQAAYRSLLRSTVQHAIRDNEDFTPERFPNASSYFKAP